VLPAYEPKFHIAEDGSHWLIIESWERLQSDPDRKKLLDAIKEWGARFRVTETWIFEAALYTLSIYCSQSGGKPDEWIWRYKPSGFHPIFTPELEQNYWYPTSGGWPEDWKTFRRRMARQFNAQLSAYRRTVEERFGIGREMIDRDAQWTARYQKGETAIEIADAEGLRGYSDAEQTVFRAISEFAKTISLRLRRRGQRVKRQL
jgi:hypothetical protein